MPLPSMCKAAYPGFETQRSPKQRYQWPYVLQFFLKKMAKSSLCKVGFNLLRRDLTQQCEIYKSLVN